MATSLDGFIAGVNDDVSLFPPAGPAIEKYQSDLQDFQTVIMGRRTYEFGYDFGLKPGRAPYPHMENYVFSRTINFDSKDDNLHICELSLDRIDSIKEKAKSDVYLCGGGEFAGYLLDHYLIDELKIKLNPIILGAGIRLFGKSKTAFAYDLINTEVFDDGVQIITYQKKK